MRYSPAEEGFKLGAALPPGKPFSKFDPLLFGAFIKTDLVSRGVGTVRQMRR